MKHSNAIDALDRTILRPPESRHLFRASVSIFVAVGVGALVAIGCVLVLAARGFDFTDDAFYTLSVRDPDAFAYSVSLFGYLLHPVLYAVHGSIAGFRRLGVGMLCAVAVV